LKYPGLASRCTAFTQPPVEAAALTFTVPEAPGTAGLIVPTAGIGPGYGGGGFVPGHFGKFLASAAGGVTFVDSRNTVQAALGPSAARHTLKPQNELRRTCTDPRGRIPSRAILEILHLPVAEI